MSGNYRFYVEKMAQRRAHQSGARPLQQELNELLAFVWECDKRWK